MTWYLNKSHQSEIVFNFLSFLTFFRVLSNIQESNGYQSPQCWAIPHLDDTSEKFLFASLTELIYTWPVVALKLCYSRVVIQYSRYLKFCNWWNPDVSPVFDIWYLEIGAKRVSLEGTWMWPKLWEYDYNVLCF